MLVIALSIAFVCYQLTTPDRDEFGLIYSVPTRSPGQILVTGVEPGSPAYRAGIRKNDLISYGDNALQRANVRYALPGSKLALIVNGKRRVEVTARQMPPIASAVWFVTLIRLAFLAVAALLAWRLPQDPASRALVAFLWSYGLATSMNSGLLPTPMLSLIFLQIAQGVLFIMGTGAAALFAARFPTPSTGFAPRIMSQVAIAVAFVMACVFVAGNVLAHTGTAVSLINVDLFAGFVLIGLLVLATFVVTYLQGAREERQRRQWVFLLIGFALFGPIVDILVAGAFGFQQWLDLLTLLPLGLLPIGLAYVILRHRVIDVGFVLNRAVVYTGVSLVIVAIFVIVETLLAKYVEQTSRAGSIAVQLVVALVLGFSVRAIHARVDRFVDTVLFRERHEAEQAMRDFAHDAPYITEAGALLNRCIEVILRHSGATRAGIWLHQETGMYAPAHSSFDEGAVDENDSAAVAMRSRRAIVDLHKSGSAFPGVLAFPMIVRGELTGILVLGDHKDGETYAPDEREAVAAVTTAVGHALDGLRIAELQATVQRLLAMQDGGATQGAMGTF